MWLITLIDQFAINPLIAFFQLEHEVLTSILRLSLVIVFSGLVYALIHGSVIRLIKGLIARNHWKFGQYLTRNELFSRVLKLLPISLVIGSAPYLGAEAVVSTTKLISNIILAYLGGALVFSLMNASQEIMEDKGLARKLPVKTLTQMVKIITVIVCGIVIASNMMGKSPAYLLSGLGALSAISMLVFKDTILGLVAGIQLTAQKIVSKGDWVEMAKFGADGEVIDITLNTVKIRNWDNTITSIPAHYLISESLKNWSPMLERARKIQRSLLIESSSIKFLSSDDIERLMHVNLLRDYLISKRSELDNTNRIIGNNELLPLNGRQLTNIGTFREYVRQYLLANRHISDSETLMVRQKPTEGKGIPLEIYCFTKDTAWVHFECVQSDIFDHLMAVLPIFGLRLFQHPSSADLAYLGNLKEGQHE